METTTLDNAVAVVNEAAEKGGSEGLRTLMNNPSFMQAVSVLGTLHLKGYRPTDRPMLVFSTNGLVQLGSDTREEVVCRWGELYSGEVLNLSQLHGQLSNAWDRHLENVKRDETVDRLLKAAPDVAAALTPEGVEKGLYLRLLLAQCMLITGDGSEVVKAVINAGKRAPFLKGTGKVDFLRGKSAEGMYWIKPLN